MGMSLTISFKTAEALMQENKMTLLLVDAFCALLVALGITLLVKRPKGRRGAIRPEFRHPSDNPQTYVRRISGSMLMVFGLALGLMETIFRLT